MDEELHWYEYFREKKTSVIWVIGKADIRNDTEKGLAAYKEAGIDAHGYVCDVTNEEQVNAMVAQIAKDVAPIDILVNNAGIIKRIPMCDMTAAEFRQVIDVDLNAPVTKATFPSSEKFTDILKSPFLLILYQ